MSQNLQNFVKFQKFQFENLVDFEKCCKTHIFLQKSEPIQPKTSNILPRFCQPTLSDVSASELRAMAVSHGALVPHRAGKARGLGCCNQAASIRHGGDVRERRLAKFRQNVARFRLYRLRFLQENMRFAAFFKIYQILKLKFLKFGKKFANFAPFAIFLLKFHENCCFFKPIFCENFEIAAVQKDANLVELEKCCRMHIFLQKFVLIQPRTSPLKICKILNFANFSRISEAPEFFRAAYFRRSPRPLACAKTGEYGLESAPTRGWRPRSGGPVG